MTIRELYEWAEQNGVFDLAIHYNDSGCVVSFEIDRDRDTEDLSEIVPLADGKNKNAGE